MSYTSFDWPKTGLLRNDQDIDSNLLQYVDGLESTAEALADVWTSFGPWPWIENPQSKFDGVVQLLPKQSTGVGSESDSGSSCRSNSQSVSSPRDAALTRQESRRERRLEQNRAAQRAFRERKEKALVELQDKILLLKQEASELLSENEQLQNALAEAQKTIEVLRSVVPSPEVLKSSVIPFVKPSGPKPSASSRSFLVKIDLNGLICACGSAQIEPALSVAQIGCREQSVVSTERGIS